MLETDGHYVISWHKSPIFYEVTSMEKLIETLGTYVSALRLWDKLSRIPAVSLWRRVWQYWFLVRMMPEPEGNPNCLPTNQPLDQRLTFPFQVTSTSGMPCNMERNFHFCFWTTPFQQRNGSIIILVTASEISQKATMIPSVGDLTRIVPFWHIS